MMETTKSNERKLETRKKTTSIISLLSDRKERNVAFVIIDLSKSL